MTKQELENIIAAEKTLYLGDTKAQLKAKRRSLHPRYMIWRYLYCFRMCGYYREKRKNACSIIEKRMAKYLFRYYDRKRNKAGQRAGVEIGLNSRIGACVDIWHGGVVINGSLGDRCVLHGGNVIGNKGFGRENETPVLGSGVEVGAGAVLIGAVRIADNCRIGAGAVVVSSFDEPGCVIAGVPATEI
ncbi:MAG: 2,3,4,5-tetrahydropyridine-2,6-carboxylate N-succinyltransferase [Clostridia bacterium]|nr:2,3,4,5-tetrahydropyridine-2,6-carboxylate N-succinyltransferase [Clostridia bacterium]